MSRRKVFLLYLGVLLAISGAVIASWVMLVPGILILLVGAALIVYVGESTK